jgi:hypothetical protein
MSTEGSVDLLHRFYGEAGAKRSSAVDRRSFLKVAGAGTVALASLPTLGSALASTAWAGELLGYHVVAVSARGHAPQPGMPQHWVIVVGSGDFHGSHVSGGGSFVHFLNPGAGGSPPFEVVADGTWKAREVMNANIIGTYGGLAAGTLELGVDLTVRATRAVVPAMLKIVCNIDPGGLQTGGPEGFTLTTGAPAGPFEPMHPELGLTSFPVLD